MNGNRIPDYEIADIVPGYTGFTQDVKTQQQKQTAGEKANGGGSVSLISPSLSFETAAKSAFTSPLRTPWPAKPTMQISMIMIVLEGK